MDTQGPPSGRFTEKQVAAILRRAAELQESSGVLAAEPGSSAKDVVQIGSELGLDPAMIQAAIAELDAEGEPRKGPSIWGGPTKVEMDRTFEGELTDEKWHAIVHEIRSTFNRVGQSSEVAGVKEWSGGERELDAINLSVSSKGGVARVRALSNMGGAAVLVGLATLFPALIVAAAFADDGPGGPLLKAIFIAVWLALAVTGFRSLYTWTCRRRQRALSRVFAKIEATLGQERAQTALEASSGVVSESQARLGVGETP